MITDVYGQQVFTEMDLCVLYLEDPNRILKKVLVEHKVNPDPSLELANFPELIEHKKLNISIEDFDKLNQSNWYMPEEYKNLDIAKFILDQCKSEEELQRAGHELLLFQERDSFMLLRYLKYLVDTMRTHNIVWGVGRGSSVSSFVLFLLGVHKINSIYYDLSIDEFLK